MNSTTDMNKHKYHEGDVPRRSECDGDCVDHDGDVKQVYVYDPESVHDWGAFNYCETAIESDKSKGFIVTESPYHEDEDSAEIRASAIIEAANNCQFYLVMNEPAIMRDDLIEYANKIRGCDG